MNLDERLAFLETENEALRSRLEEAEETLRAIQSGEVDALLIGDQVYTLESADAASNEFRGEALAQINDAVIAIDNDLHVTYLNPAAERQYDVKASEILGHELSELYAFRWPSTDVEASAWRALDTVGFWRGENHHLRHDGKKIDVESSVSRIKDRRGEPIGYLAVIRDIGKRKRAEEALRRAHAELDTRVRERTRELADANASLQQEMQERAASERQRIELLQRVVTIQEEERRRIALEIHDQLGQRVTALRFQIASLVERSSEWETLRERLEVLDETAYKLDSEVSFLTWELRPKSLDDLGLAEAVHSFLDDWQRHHGISVRFEAGGFSRERLSLQSETHLYRILQEALHNIVKHANASNVSVVLGSTATDIRLVVEDDGDGFERHGENDGNHRGLGLTGMRERAILMGGDVEIDSRLGIGTTIHVRVPRLAPIQRSDA